MKMVEYLFFSLIDEISIIIIYSQFPSYLANIYFSLLNIIIFELYSKQITDPNSFIL
jgi:hypothetical protein